MELSVTQRMAMACARRPWRTVGVWVAVVIVALASIALLLGLSADPGRQDHERAGLGQGAGPVDDQFPDRDAGASSLWWSPTAATRTTRRSGRPWPLCARDRAALRRSATSATPTPPVRTRGLVAAGTPSRTVVMEDNDEADVAGDPLVGIADVIDAVQAADRRGRRPG